MTDPRTLNEEKDQETIEAWARRAKEVRTVDEFLAFVRELDTAYVHDYGTCVHATTAAMLATFWLANRSHMTRGGLTGFQASCVGMMVVKELNGIEGPFRIVRFHDLLFPQMAEKFENRITPDTWAWLQGEARRHLAENDQRMSGGAPISAAPAVLAHWQAIDQGQVPFGFVVSEDVG